jgi:hypothetical protein
MQERAPEVALWEISFSDRGHVPLPAIVRNLTRSGASGASALGNLRE